MLENTTAEMKHESNFKSVISFFEEISKIPRCSKNEEKIAAYLENFGKSRGFETKRDAHNNIVVKIPATPGFETLPAVVLQSHMDMVCEKEADATHDFSKDALKLKYIEEDGIRYLAADKTTLGADNGIGMAYALAIAASDSEKLPHPPLELLFTTDEEIGLTGAQGMENDFISGEFMINLDSEEEGTIIVGCAGGAQIVFKQLVDVEELLPKKSDAPVSPIFLYEVRISGLKGGHSGTDIHIGRGNSNLIAAHFLIHLEEKYSQKKIELIKIKGGSASNTIPRSTELIFAADISPAVLENEAAEFEEKMLSDSKLNDRDLKIIVEEITLQKIRNEIKTEAKTQTAAALKTFSPKGTGRILRLLTSIPNGVLEMSPEIPDLVLVSGNVAIVKTNVCFEFEEGAEAEKTELDIFSRKAQREIEIIYSLRSGNEVKLKEQMKEMMDLADGNQFIAEISHIYMPWEPNFESAFLKKCADVYRKTFEKDATVAAIHAGLECGVFHRMFPSMKMISIGPDIIGAHTPDEKLNLEAAENVWIYLKEILKSFGDEIVQQ